MKNWKSLLAFLLFISLYAFAVLTKMPVAVIETTGFIALYSTCFMMLRSRALSEITKNLTEIIKLKIKD